MTAPPDRSIRPPVAWAILAMLVAGSCADKPRLGEWDGPARLGEVTFEPWTFDGSPARRAVSEHYIVHTTIEDDDLAMATAQVMEGALQQYRKLAPGVPLSAAPMDCYMFQRRHEWATFTRQIAGDDAKIYLQIARGGYAIGDVYVAFSLGDFGTYAVAAHEGWHQYVARHFKGRIPPFLEEGIACMFENINWDGRYPRWNLSINPGRALALRNAIEDRRLWPLEKLLTMHAGQIVHLPGDQIDAFYAQSWAFARFLWESQDRKYRPALQRLLTETAAGTVFDLTGSHQDVNGRWDGASVQAILEHYTAADLASLDAEYQIFIRKVAYDEFRAQWQL